MYNVKPTLGFHILQLNNKIFIKTTLNAKNYEFKFEIELTYSIPVNITT